MCPVGERWPRNDEGDEGDEDDDDGEDNDEDDDDSDGDDDNDEAFFLSGDALFCSVCRSVGRCTRRS